MNVFLGVLLIALGVGTLWAQMFTTLASVYFLGWVLIITGAAQVVYGVASGDWERALLFFIGGIISFVIGFFAITNPALSAVTFTLLIAGLLLLSGTYRIISTLMFRDQKWGWHLTGGVISLMLGIFIVLSWPASGLFVIGLFIGVELLINGILLMTQPAVFYKTAYPTYPYLSGIKGGKAKKEKEEKEKKMKKTPKN